MEFVVKKEDTFNLKDTFECGQVFRFREEGNGYIMFSGSHYAKSSEDTDNYYFETDDAEYFRKYFDLERDYKKIQDMYISDPFLKGPIEYGKGIHLLQQDKAEMIISFIISQNNNIPRIKGIIEKICLALGEDKGFYHAFPGMDKLASAGEEFYKSTGAGYRAAYLDRVSNELLNTDVEKLDELETPELREKLLSLYGVGRKVADCILFSVFQDMMYSLSIHGSKRSSEMSSETSHRTKCLLYLLKNTVYTAVLFSNGSFIIREIYNFI